MEWDHSISTKSITSSIERDSSSINNKTANQKLLPLINKHKININRHINLPITHLPPNKEKPKLSVINTNTNRKPIHLII